MIPLFQRAAVSSRCARAGQPVVLGLRLHPLSVGHSLLLLSCGSPFAGLDRDLSLADFFTAIFICAHNWRESERLLRSRFLPAYFLVWQWTQRKKSLNSEIVRFREWWEEQNETPPFQAPRESKPARPCVAPRPWVRLAFLMTEAHVPEADALDMPVLRANALQAVWLDWTGKAELLAHSPAVESGFWRFAKERDAAIFSADGTRRPGDGRETLAPH